MRPAPSREGKYPLMQAHATDPDWVLDALIRTGNEAIQRDRYLEAQL
jgi:hypothetical protein